MKKEITLEFSQSLAQVITAYTDADFIKKKAEALGARKVEVRITETADATEIEIDKEVPAEIPPFLKSFAGEYNRITQAERWTKNADGSYTGRMRIIIPNAPITIKSEMLLRQTDAGCTAETLTEVSNSVPFFGKKVNKFLLETAEKNIEKEFWFIAQEVPK